MIHTQTHDDTVAVSFGVQYVLMREDYEISQHLDSLSVLGVDVVLITSRGHEFLMQQPSKQSPFWPRVHE